MNVLNALPKSVPKTAKENLHDIWQAETQATASAAFDFFVEAYDVKRDKAVAKPVKDSDTLLAFDDFPAEHWKHIRTSNPIESPGLRPFRAELTHRIDAMTPCPPSPPPDTERKGPRD